MTCEGWNEAILGKLYGEIEPDQERLLDAHLAACAPCRASLAELGRVRVLLSENEPEVPRAPRVVLLRDTARLRPALLAASLAAAALLAGAGAGAGYALGRQSAPGAAPVLAQAPSKAEIDAAMEQAVRREVDSRLAGMIPAKQGTEPAAVAAVASGVSPETLQAELAKFERKLEGDRAQDIQYLLGEMEDLEVRTTSRIGQTNQALRYVALASNPNVSER